MTEQQKRELFIAEYKTRCGLWPATGDPVSSARWFEFIDPLPDTDFPRLFAQVVRNRGINRAKPLLDHFRAALSQVKAEAPRPQPVHCERCQGSGMISVPAREVREGKNCRMCFDERTGELRNYAFPCALCPAGKAQGESWPDGMDSDTVEQANAIWAESYRLSGARPEDEIPVSLEEFLRRKRSGDLEHLRSRTGFLHDLRREAQARQEARETGGATVGSFELPTAGETARRLLNAKAKLSIETITNDIGR